MISKLVRHLFISAAVAAPMVATVAESALAARSLTIQNNNDLAIEQLYVSVSDSGRWGRDRLRGGIIEQEEAFWVNVSGNRCYYDIKAIYEDGSYDVTTADVCYGSSYIEFYGYGGDNY